jgi:uncharacterized membrane protein YraQ (UPF0718 family)
MSRNLDMSFWMLLAGTSLLALVMAIKDPGLLAPSLQRSAYLLAGVLPELLLGFLIAGLLEVLIPQPTLMRWLGEQNAGYGILAGWVIGLLVPGGPYLKQGAAPGPLIALLTAKILLSPIRMVSYEAPSVGWPLTLARFIPSLFLPPVVAWAGQWLFQILRK